MWKQIWPLVLAALCLQCGGSAQSTPVEAPEAEEPLPASEEPATEPVTEDPAVEPDAPAEDPPEDPPAEKKSCAELQKPDCMVTRGCAWNSLGKCVEEGASE